MTDEEENLSHRNPVNYRPLENLISEYLDCAIVAGYTKDGDRFAYCVKQGQKDEDALKELMTTLVEMQFAAHPPAPPCQRTD